MTLNMVDAESLMFSLLGILYVSFLGTGASFLLIYVY